MAPAPHMPRLIMPPTHPAGDTVANMDLKPILAAHRERAESDKDAIMTLVRGNW